MRGFGFHYKIVFSYLLIVILVVCIYKPDYQKNAVWFGQLDTLSYSRPQKLPTHVDVEKDPNYVNEMGAYFSQMNLGMGKKPNTPLHSDAYSYDHDHLDLMYIKGTTLDPREGTGVFITQNGYAWLDGSRKVWADLETIYLNRLGEKEIRKGIAFRTPSELSNPDNPPDTIRIPDISSL